MSVEGFSPKQENLRDQTLEAMEAGTAMPLPEFLQEDPEARRVFAEAIKSSEELRDSMAGLTDEERDAFLQAFAEVLASDGEIGTEEQIRQKLQVKLGSKLGLGVTASGAGLLGLGLTGVALPVAITGLFIAATSVALNFKATRDLIGGSAQNTEVIKDYILKTAKGG